MSTSVSPEDPPMDEYLRAALRHAPDHALTPPAGVSQAILAAARQVHRPVRPPPEPVAARAPVPRHVTWHERLQQLLSPRWAGSLATALIGALVVGLWFDQDLPTPTLRSEEGPSMKAAERKAAAPVAPVAPAAVRDARETAAPPPALARGTATTPAAHPVAPSTAAPAQAPPAREAPVAEVAPAGRTNPMPTAPADSSDLARARDQPARNAVAEPRRTEAQVAAAAKEFAAAPEIAARPKLGGALGALARPEPVASAPGAASPALTLWRRAVAESNARTAIWTWQPANAPSPRSFDADGQAWLLRLVQTARGRWTDVAEASDGAAATEVRWWRDDRAIARLRIEAQGLRWLEPSGRIRFAPLEADALARLRGF